MALNLTQIIHDLRTEELRLDAAIAALEEVERKNAESPRRSTRGRKSMGAEERLRVGARMKRYWAGRKTKAAMGGAP